MDEINAIASLGLGNSCMKDKNGVVTIEGRAVTSEEQPLIKAEVTRLQAEYDALQYQRDRTYPTWQEQMEMLFHDMTPDKGSKTGEWYKAIAKVKADNPK